MTVKTSTLAGEVRNQIEKITALLSTPTPPDLVLNRHDLPAGDTKMNQEMVAKLASAHERLMQKVAIANAAGATGVNTGANAKYDPKHSTKQEGNDNTKTS